MLRMPKLPKVEKLTFARRIAAVLATIAFASVDMSHAETYFIDAAAGARGNGSVEAPWDSPITAWRSGRLKGGDVVKVAAGRYGFIKLHDVNFEAPVVFEAEPGAHATQIELADASNMTFRGFQVWPLRPTSGHLSIVRGYFSATDIIFENMELRSVPDAGRYMSWSLKDWTDRKVSGFLLNGDRNEVRNSTLTGMSFGIAVTGKDSQVIGNKITGFSGDGIRGLGDGTLIAGNHIKDCVKIDGNHDDGIQSWTHGKDRSVGTGTQRDLHVTGNIVEEWTGNKSHPLICDLQGMLFGGTLVDLVITNNAVSVSAWHGISAANIKGGLIANNTVVNSRNPDPKRPWIGVLGGDNRNVTIANNIAAEYSVPHALTRSIDQNRNLRLSHPVRELVAPNSGDYRLKPDSGLRGRAIAAYAPDTDLTGAARDSAPDIGAFELP